MTFYRGETIIQCGPRLTDDTEHDTWLELMGLVGDLGSQVLFIQQ